MSDGEDIPIHFDQSPANTAVYEQGGPIHREMTAEGAGTGFGHNKENGHEVPHSGNGAKSGIAKDLHLSSIKGLRPSMGWGRKKEESGTSSGSV